MNQRRWAVLAAAVLLPVAGLVVLWRSTDSTAADQPQVTLPPTTVAAPAAPAAPLNTPLMSYRRVGSLLADNSANVEALRGQLNAFAPQLGDRSCMSVRVGGVEVATHNADLPVIPASNQKLLTGAAALQVLGGDFRFTTTAAAVAVSDGVVTGDLYLIGGGDPVLVTPDYPPDGQITANVNPTDLNQLAVGLATAGVTRIDGSVIGDGARYDDEYQRPGWGTEGVIGTEVSPYDALMVNDSRRLGAEWEYDSDPIVSAATEFTRLLTANGITVTGAPGAGAAPAEATAVASIQSQPLTEIVGGMLESSDNNTAEMLVKEIGVASGGGGSSTAGAAAMLPALAELGVDTTNLVIVDGSGLSTDNRLTCRALSEVLAVHSPTDALGARLPIAGQTGTLTDVFVGESVAGRLRAKTGVLQNMPFSEDPPAVRSLSGYLPVDGAEPIEFALVMNEPGPLDQGDYRPRWYAFANALASYPAAPVPALGPR